MPTNTPKEKGNSTASTPTCRSVRPPYKSAGPGVTSELVGPEPVERARARERVQEVQCHRAVTPDDRGQQHEGDDRGGHDRRPP